MRNHTLPTTLLALFSGILIGVAATCFLARQASARRDALLVNIYQGLAGARSVAYESEWRYAEAYANQMSVVMLMEHAKEAVGFDLIPWSLSTPFSSAMQSLVMPVPNTSWPQAEIATQRARLTNLRRLSTCEVR
ncbi:hypothetical protein [Niveibacterium terrae]|uniref:hypothetical protein n=1 Tax=Niveibacterium terrae TaxID=3373598 RepID=UPI003A8CB559